LKVSDVARLAHFKETMARRRSTLGWECVRGELYDCSFPGCYCKSHYTFVYASACKQLLLCIIRQREFMETHPMQSTSAAEPANRPVRCYFAEDFAPRATKEFLNKPTGRLVFVRIACFCNVV
jgi:hypothetical protein